MKKTKIYVLTLSALCLLSFTACSQGNGSAEQTTTKTEATLDSSAQAAITDIEVGESELLENGNVRWLAEWDLNPTDGKAMPVEMELFRDRFGGTVEWIKCGFDERYDMLAKLVLAGDSPDLFSAGDLDVFPGAAVVNLIDPMDDYIDFSDPIWDNMSEVNSKFIYKNKHYVAATSTDAGVVMIYNKAVFADNALDDPAQLLADGNWNWDSFYNIMTSFCDRSESKFAVDGWWFEGAISMTTGVPYIGFENNQLTNNISSPLIAEAQEFMANMKKEDLPFPKDEYGWQINPANIAAGKTLFYPCGIWALYQTDLSQFGKADEIMFVPMPKCPSTEEYFVPASMTGFVLCAGAPNPEAAAAYIKCAVTAQSDERVAEIAKDQYMNEYGWSDDMYNMLLTTREMTAENPVFEFYNAISDDVAELINNPMKDSFNNGASWTQTRTTIIDAVESGISDANAKLAAAVETE